MTIEQIEARKLRMHPTIEEAMRLRLRMSPRSFAALYLPPPLGVPVHLSQAALDRREATR
jgi:hypothetical protein